MTRTVLGVCAFTHDSASALVADGTVVGLVEEDRLLGEKHTKRFPERSIERLLGARALGSQDVNVVGYNYSAGELALGLARALRNTRGLTADRRRARIRSWGALPALHRKHLRELKRRFPTARIVGVPHHRCHAIGAALSSGLDDAAVLSIDSIGEGRTTVLSRWQNGRLATLHSEWDTNSLGYVYGAITEHLGYRRGNEEGTVMALAALGDRSVFRDLALRAISLSNRGFSVDPACFPPRHFGPGPPRTGDMIASFVPRRAAGMEISQVHADLAAAFQERTEEAVIHLARVARRRTGSRHLVLTGGVALNCVSNARVLDEAGFDSVYVPPSPGDAGTPLGAAAALWTRLTGSAPSMPAQEAMLGVEFSTGEIHETIRASGLRSSTAQDVPSEVALRLAAGEVVGVFVGRAETGPRALGHRSILASPFIPQITKRLSESVKQREPFRPFAPVLRDRDVERFFDTRGASPFMSFAFRASAELCSVAPAVVHIDGTARVQTVTPGHILHSVIDRFEALGAPPVIINTSLNQKGHPTSGTPEQALQCFVAARLDGLILGDQWVVR